MPKPNVPELRSSMQRLRRVIASNTDAEANAETDESLDEFKRRAAAAFEDGMQPVRNAIVEALQTGDVEALQGLRAMLPHLLAEVNRAPALADLMAHQLGKAVLDGMKTEYTE